MVSAIPRVSRAQGPKTAKGPEPVKASVRPRAAIRITGAARPDRETTEVEIVPLIKGREENPRVTAGCLRFRSPLRIRNSLEETIEIEKTAREAAIRITIVRIREIRARETKTGFRLRL